MPNLGILRALLRTTVGLLVLGVASSTPAPLPPLVLNPSTQTRPAVTATGHVAGLAPGKAGSLTLTIRNSGDVRAVVRRLTPLGSPKDGDCRLLGAEWSGTSSLAAGASVTQVVPVQVVGQGCQGKTWRLEYEAQS